MGAWCPIAGKYVLGSKQVAQKIPYMRKRKKEEKEKRRRKGKGLSPFDLTFPTTSIPTNGHAGV